MLVDPQFLIDALSPLVGYAAPVRLAQGVYRIEHFNFGLLLRKPWSDIDIDSQLPPGGAPRYGVCDSVGQFILKYGDALKDAAGSYCLAFTRVVKAKQSPVGGWRWDKWGPYIGNGEPTTEYLRDEPKFEEVFVFSVFRLREGAKDSGADTAPAATGEFERATGGESYEWSIPTAPDPGRSYRLFVAIEPDVSRLVCIEETPVTSAKPGARRMEVEPERRRSVTVTLDEARWLLATLPKAIEKIEAVWAAGADPAQGRPES